MAEWISVKERLPDRNQGYIIVWDLEEVDVCDTRAVSKWGYEAYVRFFENNDIKFWLPIPPPPKSETEATEPRRNAKLAKKCQKSPHKGKRKAQAWRTIPRGAEKARQKARRRARQGESPRKKKSPHGAKFRDLKRKKKSGKP